MPCKTTTRLARGLAAAVLLIGLTSLGACGKKDDTKPKLEMPPPPPPEVAPVRQEAETAPNPATPEASVSEDVEAATEKLRRNEDDAELLATCNAEILDLAGKLEPGQDLQAAVDLFKAGEYPHLEAIFFAPEGQAPQGIDGAKMKHCPSDTHAGAVFHAIKHSFKAYLISAPAQDGKLAAVAVRSPAALNTLPEGAPADRTGEEPFDLNAWQDALPPCP